MAFLIDDLVFWIGGKIKDMAEEELYGDKDKIHQRLLELQAKLDMGEMDEEEYKIKEQECLEALQNLQERKEGDNGDSKNE